MGPVCLCVCVSVFFIIGAEVSFECMSHTVIESMEFEAGEETQTHRHTDTQTDWTHLCGISAAFLCDNCL